MKKVLLLTWVVGVLAGCSSPQKTTYTAEELERIELQSQIDSLEGQIRFHQEMIRIKQTELAATRSAASSYDPESAPYIQLTYEADTIRDRIKELNLMIEQKDARLTQLRAEQE